MENPWRRCKYAAEHFNLSFKGAIVCVYIEAAHALNSPLDRTCVPPTRLHEEVVEVLHVLSHIVAFLTTIGSSSTTELPTYGTLPKTDCGHAQPWTLFQTVCQDARIMMRPLFNALYMRHRIQPLPSHRPARAPSNAKIAPAAASSQCLEVRRLLPLDPAPARRGRMQAATLRLQQAFQMCRPLGSRGVGAGRTMLTPQ